MINVFSVTCAEIFSQCNTTRERKISVLSIGEKAMLTYLQIIYFST
jgi:hypothetical protein